MPIYVKNTLGLLVQNQESFEAESWYVTSGTQDLLNFIQMMTLGWLLNFLRQGQICVPMHLYGENIETSFCQTVTKTNGWNLLCMVKVANPFSNAKNVPRVISRGFICPYPWAVYMY